MLPRLLPHLLLLRGLLLSPVLLCDTSMAELWRCDFEVFGKVQGVFFRKYTQGKAQELGVKGWCQNSPRGTVVGAIEGEKRSFNMMKDWLSRVGSPSSSIDKAVFKEEKQIQQFSFNDFSIKR
ncbi:acylphosphatase-2 [Halyomorpha halys]|uniref:acylphosphatase-2 n=1 Tax=Halyomorpha halys TaxID=286706 RepID=UPI0006D522D4|nr:acylphosphatase-2 [Halyomorpha halys]XP_014270767.1 acylphosphatase-2 [Halyomorpha halys]